MNHLYGNVHSITNIAGAYRKKEMERSNSMRKFTKCKKERSQDTNSSMLPHKRIKIEIIKETTGCYYSEQGTIGMLPNGCMVTHRYICTQ